MTIPTPGKPVRGSNSGSPLMAAFDLLGRRWAMGIIWHLHDGPATFRGLQAYCESISPSILNRRLKELREAQIITRTLDGYELTALGQDLFNLLKPFSKWAISWAEKIAPDEVRLWKQKKHKTRE
ncbi:MAG: helix-turn-helix transcriptional regulator [Deltaproteobacteria bacterium]|nr:helix-turn-helix transcriptional regulator [Deltaproteobacteria bacterium]